MLAYAWLWKGAHLTGEDNDDVHADDEGDDEDIEEAMSVNGELRGLFIKKPPQNSTLHL